MAYMDNFKNAYEYIRFEATANKGNKTTISKEQLIKLAQSHGLDTKKSTTKIAAFDMLYDKLDINELEKELKIGISSYCFQQKFNITNKEVKYMASQNFIKITGHEYFKMFGRYQQASTYSVVDFFRLTSTDVENWLTTNKPKRIKGNI